jgi:transcriptional regulator with XRE-family HTH domain
MGRRENRIIITEVNPHRARLGNRMRTARDAAGLTNAKLAARTGYDKSTISTAADGEHVRSVEVFRAYMTACSVDPDTLMEEYEAAKNEETANRASQRRSSIPNPRQEPPSGNDTGPWWRRMRREGSVSRIPHGEPVPVPINAQTSKEFVACMKEVRRWAGATYGDIERTTRNQLPRSTLHGILNRETLPIHWEPIEDFLYACGVGNPELTEWARAWKRLATKRP